MLKPEIKSFFDPGTWTFTYVVYEKPNSPCVVIDSVMNYDPKSGRTSTTSADEVIAFIQKNHLQLEWILETHAHADHLSAAHYLKQKTGAPVAIGEGIKKVQQTFKLVFNIADDELMAKGDYFDKLFADNETFSIGNLSAKVVNTPGHTNDSVSYLIAGNLFVGDSLFMPDAGTARCDFPGGDAHILFRSIQRIYQLPDETQIFMCHDYQPGGRELKYQTSVLEQKTQNIHVKADTPEQEFVQKREARDKTLAVPRLIYPSVQVNIRGGQLPKAQANGVSYIKVPLTLK
mgnify:CR=1 FL=1